MLHLRHVFGVALRILSAGITWLLLGGSSTPMNVSPKLTTCGPYSLRIASALFGFRSHLAPRQPCNRIAVSSRLTGENHLTLCLKGCGAELCLQYGTRRAPWGRQRLLQHGSKLFTNCNVYRAESNGLAAIRINREEV